MALISCTDCGKQISNHAPACPECGRPMKSSMVLGSSKTIELTAKRFKFISMISILVLILGLVIMGVIRSVSGEFPTGPTIGGCLVFLRLGGYIVNRVRIWWHHK